MWPQRSAQEFSNQQTLTSNYTQKQLSHFKHFKNYIFLHDLINLFMPSSMIVLDFQIFITFFSDCARIKKYIVFYQDQFFIEKTFNRNQDIFKKSLFFNKKRKEITKELFHDL